MRRYLVFFLTLVSCGPNTPEEYRLEGESIIKQLHSDLTKIETLADLKSESPKIKKKFTALTDLIIRGKTRELMHSEGTLAEEPSGHLSEQLRAEFIRIYQIEGCQKLMEDLQRESLHRLDLYKEG